MLAPIIRWTPGRKIHLLGMISRSEVCEEAAMAFYEISREEIECWRRAATRGGSALYVTKGRFSG